MDVTVDRALTIALYGGDASTPLTQIMLALSFIGGGWALVAFLPLLARRRTRAGARTLLLALLAQIMVVGALKRVFGRTRPYLVLGWHPPSHPPPTDYAFPSGHAAGSFTVAAFLVAFALMSPPFRGRAAGCVFVVALAGAIAYSRVFLGVHWAGDVVGGAVVGTLFGWVAARQHFAGGRGGDGAGDRGGIAEGVAETRPFDPKYPRLIGRRVRLVVLVAWVVAVWSVALPAFASGPLCDDRGASRDAPSPVLIVAPDTLDVDPSARVCDAASVEQSTYGRDRAPAEPDATPDTSALAAPIVSFDGAFVAPLLVDPNPPAGGYSAGVRDRVERPPRA